MFKHIVISFHFLLFILAFDLLIAAEKNPSLQEIYDSYSRSHEHLSYLRAHANECSSVIEIGKPFSELSWGILKGLSENAFLKRSYLAIHLEKAPAERLELAQKIAKAHEIDLISWPVNDLYINILPVDMLFIHSMHTYCHVTYQLEHFSQNVRKYICVHGTTGPWNSQDDQAYQGNYSEYPLGYDRKRKGVWLAIFNFLGKHPEWSMTFHLENKEGLTILKRIQPSPIADAVYHPAIEDVLKNKIILCTGPALGRYEMLQQSTERDINIMPFKKIFVTTNDPSILPITFNGIKPARCVEIPKREKHIDCFNCILSTLKNALQDPEVKGDDIILFKHESVFINDMHLIKSAISKILNGYDLVVRRWLPSRVGAKLTDAFFVRVSALRGIIENYPLLDQFPPQGPHFCEEYITVNILDRIKNIYDIPYRHSNGGFTELGFYHHVSTDQAQRRMWDKKNYHDLFK